jgi:transcriptional regulator with XRE-family HTH domain
MEVTIMDIANAVRQRIINIAKKKNIKIHKLTMNAGVPYSTVSSFLNGKSNSLTISTILHLCEGADMSLGEFFDDPLFNNVTAKRKGLTYKI